MIDGTPPVFITYGTAPRFENCPHYSIPIIDGTPPVFITFGTAPRFWYSPKYYMLLLMEPLCGSVVLSNIASYY
jgi:hypothetical protein